MQSGEVVQITHQLYLLTIQSGEIVIGNSVSFQITNQPNLLTMQKVVQITHSLYLLTMQS